MISKSMTALALVAGLTTVAADARPTPKQNSAEKAMTRQLNQQQLASASNGTMGGGAMANSPAGSSTPQMMAPADGGAAGMNGPAAGMNAPPAPMSDPTANPAAPAGPGDAGTPPDAAPPAAPQS